ncbi:MAG: hypothetical protein NUV94_03815 [Candidatus Acetothermia bacterium]|nr:hypothetical protein [Candidatus Acetothermia bacterium]
MIRRVVAVLVVGAWAIAQAQVPLIVEQVSPAQVLDWLERSSLPPEVKASWLGILPGAFAQGTVDPRVAKPFFEALATVPVEVAIQLTQILIPVLQQGVVMDHLLVTASKAIAKGMQTQRWDYVASELQLRARLGAATFVVLGAYSPALRMEVARILGDFITGVSGSFTDYDGMLLFVQSELGKLARTGTPLAPEIDALLAAVRAPVLAQIMERVLQPERR